MTGNIMSIASMISRRPRAARSPPRVCPSRYSITRYGISPSVPTSVTRTMLGWLMRAAISASRKKRARASGTWAMDASSVLIANRFFKTGWNAS